MARFSGKKMDKGVNSAKQTNKKPAQNAGHQPKKCIEEQKAWSSTGKMGQAKPSSARQEHSRNCESVGAVKCDQEGGRMATAPDMTLNGS
jgi:hypothetical protein